MLSSHVATFGLGSDPAWCGVAWRGVQSQFMVMRQSCCALYAARHDRGSIISPISVHSASAIRVGTALHGIGRTAQQAQPTNGQRRSAATLDEPASGSRSGFRRASTRVWDDQEVHGVWSLVAWEGSRLLRLSLVLQVDIGVL